MSKVYCEKCYWFYESNTLGYSIGCHNNKHKTIKETPKSKEKYLGDIDKLNKDNNCKEFKVRKRMPLKYDIFIFLSLTLFLFGIFYPKAWVVLTACMLLFFHMILWTIWDEHGRFYWK